jgi:hypothetical protein
VLVAVVVSACRVDATLRIDVAEDGSGTVTLDVLLDADAVARAETGGGTLEERVRLADLDAAGWEAIGWERRDDGSASISLVHGFATPEEAGELVADLNGTTGPVPELALTRASRFFETEFAINGVIDLGAVESGIVSDEDLRAALEANGLPVEALDTRVLEAAQGGLAVTVEVSLPGDETVTASAAHGERAPVDGQSAVTDTRRIVLAVSAFGLVTLAVLIALVAWRGTRRRAGSSRTVR